MRNWEFAVGAAVIARGERCLVERVIEHADCVEIHLSGRNEPSVLLSPFDRVDPIDLPRRHAVVRHRRWGAHIREHDAAARVGGLAARSSGAAVLPYQLAPALAVASGEARILLADEVGLGKTIQAGWIVAHLVAEHADARVLIAVPAGLRLQWQAELSAGFGLATTIADAAWLRRTAAELPGDVSPWSLPGVYITSLDFVKRPDVVRSLGSRAWDAVVVDEAHTVRSPTERHRAVENVASRARCIVLISATPFSGDVRSFDSIASLGAFRESPPLLTFRRSREDIAAGGRRKHRFVPVQLSREERDLQVQLARYTEEVWKTDGEYRERAQLAMIVLRKRALSSPCAVLRSLRRRLELLDQHGAQALGSQLELFPREDEADDGEPLAALAAPGLHDEGHERQWLMRLVGTAERASGRDAKRLFLQRLVRRLHAEPAIVFTEYRDSLAHLAAAFPGALQLHGAMPPAERWRVQQQFNARGGLLIATDAASEGLNLHGRCRLVVNYELPWNPVRLEQRIGRVDRIGQQRPVHALTLVARHTAEDFVLLKLARRLYRIASTLGERDRLAFLLDEARTAGIIIGREPWEEANEEPLRPRLVTDDSFAPRAQDESVRLRARRLRVGLSPALHISSMRASTDLEAGLVFAYCWRATAGDGSVVESRVLVFHVADAIERVRSARTARAVALAAIDRWEPVLRPLVDGHADRCLARVQTAHEAIVRAKVRRERALASSLEGPGLFQAGLFDRRAMDEARQESLNVNAAASDHESRIAALERHATLQSRCDLLGILLVSSS